MANLKFLKGNYASLGNAAITEGQILVTKDTRELFVDVDASTRIKIGDFTVIANLTALEALDATQVPTSRLYYVEDGNILARSNGTTWIQVNKQKTAAELKEFLGLGDLAYLSEVGEDNLSEELAAKVNASAEGNHAHANKELLDTYTQTEADLADAVTKKHTHTFVETELNKIVDGDVAKWNAVVEDHLTADDKTALENAIKEAKKAGTDANTNIEAYKVTNDARVLAVEEDVAEITNADNGILAQAKTYSDGKLATARTEITAEIDADVKVVADDLAGYKTSNDAALAGVKATAEAAATKEYTDAELAKKVDKVTGKSLVDDAEITKLASVSEGANKVEVSENNGKIKIDGVETTVYTHPEKHAIADVDGLGDALAGLQVKGDYAAEGHKHTKEDITDFAHTHIASEITDLDATIKGYDYATKTEAKAYADAKDEAIAAAKKAGDDAQDAIDAYIEANDKALADEAKAREDADKAINDKIGTVTEGKTVVEMIAEAQSTATYDDEEVRGLISDNADAIAAETERATGIEAGLRTDVDVIKGDYLKAADKTELEGKIKSNADAIELLTNGVDPETVDGVNDLIQYVKDHGTEVTGIKADIAANTKAIEDHEALAAATYETKDDASAKLTEAKGYTDIAKAAVIGTAEDASSADTVYGAKKYAEEKASAAQSAAEATAAGALASAKTELEGKITDGDAATLASAEAKVAELAGNVYTKTEVDTAVEAAKTDASNKDAVVLAEAQAYADQAEADAVAAAEGKVNALAGNVYTKTETYTQAEVDAAIEAAVTSATEWGSF